MNQEEGLNKLLATLAVFRQALYTMHWEIVGEKFYEFHTITNDMYDAIGDKFDSVAERIRMLGGTPTTTLSAYVKNSTLPELTNGKDWNTGVLYIDVALRSLISSITALIKVAKKEDDEASVGMLATCLECLQKRLWMNTAYMGSKSSSPSESKFVKK